MKQFAPYKLFFPIGLLNAVLSISVWFTQELGWFSSPSLLIHSKLVSGGFLWSFIVGFLMTAVPRMTGAMSANRLEYVLSFLLITILMYFSWNMDARYFYATHILLVLFLLVYGLRRIISTNKSVPVFFSHIIIAMLLTITGALYYYQGNSYMGFHLYHVGSILLLVLGIGTRFFSFLSGLPSEFENNSSAQKKYLFHIMGLMTAVFLLLAGSGIKWAYLALSILMTIYMYRIWCIFRHSDRPSALKYSVRFVALIIPLSFFLSWLQPLMYITWFHLLFIGCFGIITLSVATRVILAHGAYSTDLELNSKTLWWSLSLLILALIARIGYGFTSDFLWKKSFLHTAATLWVLAILVWSYSYLIKIFKDGNLPKPSC